MIVMNFNIVETQRTNFIVSEGGATVAANANVNERCLNKHGRWKSESSKDRYIVDSADNRLQVSQALGI
jgi:hypothetical protein